MTLMRHKTCDRIAQKPMLVSGRNGPMTCLRVAGGELDFSMGVLGLRRTSILNLKRRGTRLRCEPKSKIFLDEVVLSL
jgi:hypothetical protein